MSDIRRIASISLASAKSCLTKGNYGRAFANLLLFLKLEPESRNEVRVEFALATREWTELLEKDGRTDILFKCYDQACEMFPDHDIVLNNIGAQLFRLGYVEEAAAYIRKSLLINPEYLAARENLENICSHLVERWHFRMLNDTDRNYSFNKAILLAVRDGFDRVLDIGTGTGILSLMCIKSRAKEVYAVERSLAMYEVAQDVIQANHADSKIVLLHKSSTNLKIPEDIPERVNLVVTETFDAGLFGEHVVSTLCHAWRELITNIPGQVGRVIPGSASVYVCGIECEGIRNQTRLLYPVLQELDLTQLQFLCTTGNVSEDPYTTENLSRIKGGYHVITSVNKLLTVDFCSPQQLETMNRGIDWSADLMLKQSGRLDALAVWFDLHLDKDTSITTRPEQETCWEQAVFPVFSLSRSPDKPQAAVDNTFLKAGSKLRTTFHFANDCLHLTELQVDPQSKFEQVSIDNRSKKASPTLDNNFLSNQINQNNSHSKRSSHASRCRKNKTFTKDTYSKTGAAAECVPEQTSRNSYSNSQGCKHEPVNAGSELDTLHLQLQYENGDFDFPYIEDKEGDDMPSTSFSTNGNSVTKELDNSQISSDTHIGRNTDTEASSAEEKDCVRKVSDDVVVHGREICLLEQADILYLNDIQLNRLYCQVLHRFIQSQPSSKQLSMLQISRTLCLLGVQANKMGFSDVTVITPENNHASFSQVAKRNGCPSDVLHLQEPMDIERLSLKADLILCEMIEPCGAFRQQVLEDLALLKTTCLSEGGIIVPAEVRVHGIFIQSRELENASLVTGNDKTLGFNIANYINVFQSQNHVDIELATLPHTKLSEAFELLHLKLNELPLDGSKLPQFLQQSHKLQIPVIDCGNVTALVYWFELVLFEDITVRTIDTRMHWKQAAIMIKGDNCVLPGETLVTHITLQNTCLDVKIEETPNVPGMGGTSAIIIGV